MVAECPDMLKVEDQMIKDEVIVGKDVINFAELAIIGGIIKMKKIRQPSSIPATTAEETIPDIFNIDVINTEPVVDLTHIKDPIIRQKVEELIESYVPVQPKKSCIQIKLTLIDEIPVHCRPRRLSPSDKEVVNKQIEERLREGVMQPSNSDYTSPVVVVKKDGSNRLCIDYRNLNQKIIKDHYPMPLI